VPARHKVNDLFWSKPVEFCLARQFVTFDGDQKIWFQVGIFAKQFIEMLTREEKQSGVFGGCDCCGAVAVSTSASSPK